MKRLKKILKWTGVVLVVLVAIGLIANAWLVWTTDARLERQLEEIRAAGDPVSLAELTRPPIPPEQNAATYLRQAEADVEAIYDKLRHISGEDIFSGRLISLERQKVFQSALDAGPKAIPLILQAAACPDYDPQLDYTLPNEELNDQLSQQSNQTRLATLVLYRHAILLVCQGKRDEAVRVSMAILKLANHCERNPTIFDCIVAIAIRDSAIDVANLALQTGSVSQEVREALDSVLACQEHSDIFPKAAKNDQAFVIDYYRSAVPFRNRWLITRWRVNLMECCRLEMLQDFLALARDARPYREAKRDIEDRYHQKGWLVGLIGFTLKLNANDAIIRSRARIRCLRVLNALQTHVPAGSDETPKLGELGLPLETTTDPYTGEPLHVKKLPQGWLVYSVGKDFQDDGGKLDEWCTDVGVGPPLPIRPSTE